MKTTETTKPRKPTTVLLLGSPGLFSRRVTASPESLQVSKRLLLLDQTSHSRKIGTLEANSLLDAIVLSAIAQILAPPSEALALKS